MLMEKEEGNKGQLLMAATIEGKLMGGVALFEKENDKWQYIEEVSCLCWY